jgi:hypothetical protein
MALVASEVWKWIVEELWAHMLPFRSLDLDKWCKSHGFPKVLASLPKQSFDQTIFAPISGQSNIY